MPTTVTLVAALCALTAVGRPAAAVEPTWFDLVTSESLPQGLAAGPDGRMWVAGRGASELVRIAPDGAQSSYGLEFGVDPFAIVQGPDGAMWFTEINGSRIGRMTVDGNLSEFNLRDRSNPTGITVGSDGALWFTQRGVSSIGRLSIDGVLSEWATLTPRASPLSIAAGSDGALWFTQPAVNSIARITTDGSITEFPLPTPARNPQWIAAGPDGALWFTERATDSIGRMSVGGQLTEYAVPTAAAGVNGIAVGPDGALWFTESGANAVGRITTLGEVSEIPVGLGTSPTGIAAGPDGQLWFSAPGTNQVGRIAPAASADVTPPTVTIASPRDGSVLLEGEGMLADYTCVDEQGGSGVVSCDGPVPDGAVVPNSLGSHTFTVTATDREGNRGSATHGYVVFDDISGPITHQAVFAAGRTIPIGLGLGSRPQGSRIFVEGSPIVRALDCATGEPTGAEEPAEVLAHIGASGRLQVLWRIGAGWGGSCRSLVLRLAFAGWSDADAVFTIRLG